MKGMMPGAEKHSAGTVINRDDLERTAARMGTGVRLVSAEKATGDPGFEGTKAIFAFDDINQVQISQAAARAGACPPNRPRMIR
jgi:hypothetical protein